MPCADHSPEPEGRRRRQPARPPRKMAPSKRGKHAGARRRHEGPGEAQEAGNPRRACLPRRSHRGDRDHGSALRPDRGAVAASHRPLANAAASILIFNISAVPGQDYSGKDIRETADGYHLTGALSTMMTWVTKLDGPPPGVPTTTYPQFVGRAGGTHDMAGMSGCPIFGFEKGRDDRYWIVAIQNSWIRPRRIIFGTPVPVLGARIEEQLALIEEHGEDSHRSNP